MEQSAVQSIKVRGIWSQNAGADNGAGAEIGARSEQPSRIAKEPPGGRGAGGGARQLTGASWHGGIGSQSNPSSHALC